MPRLDEIRRALDEALASGADFAEFFLEDRLDLTMRREGGSLSGATSLHIRGAGLHLLKGSSGLYLHSNDASAAGLVRLARQAAELAPLWRSESARGRAAELVLSPGVRPTPTPVALPPGSVELGRKARVLAEMEKAARDEGGLRSLAAVYFDTVQRVLVANSEGLAARDERTRTRVRLDATVELGDQSMFEFDDIVGPCGFELFEGDYEGFARGQVASMKARLAARPAPSCVVPVVIEGGSGGVLWHEACGHPLEAENLVEGLGEFGGKFGQAVASPKVTLLDDGSLPGMYGSEAIDDEGLPTRPTVLIDKGVLVGCLCGRKGARLAGREPTGSGRRQSYAYAPASRMHNTYLAPGEDDEDEMIRSMAEGLFVTELGGGDSGAEFSIEVKDAFWVRNGEISHRVRGLTLSGNSLEMMKKVDRVGRRLVPERGGSFCGAGSGLVPTTAFQPRIRVSEMTVGGSSA